MKGIIVIDNFFDDPDQQLEASNTLEYKDYDFNGQVFPKIAVDLNPEGIKSIANELQKALESTLLPFFRRYTREDKQPTFIHSDVMEGEYTCIVYLNKTNTSNGIAFWEHRGGETQADATNVTAYKEDGLDESKWKDPLIIEAKFNRAVIFESALFHSRWPRENWNTGGEDRLIKVFFLKEIQNEILLQS